jgi:small GTP-binding protein
MAGEFPYDVFISYAATEQTAALELAARLRSDGIKVWLDVWQIQPGDLIPITIERGLAESRVLVLLMSSAAFRSAWVTLERTTATFRDPMNTKRRFVPVRVDDCVPPESLRQYASIDWRNRSSEEYARLLAACRFLPEESTADAPACDGAAVRVFSEHGFFVRGVAITGDGRIGVSGSVDKTLRVWDLDGLSCSAILKGHTGALTGVAISQDGRIAVSGSHDTTVRVWDVNTRKSIAILQGHLDGVTGVAVSGNGRYVISGSADNTIRVWNVKTASCSAVLEAHADWVLGVALTPDGHYALSSSYDGTVRFWDVKTRTCIATLLGHTSAVSSVAIDRAGTVGVSASRDSTVRVWNLRACKALATLEGHTAPIDCVALTPDGRWAVSGSEDRTVRVWDTKTGACTQALRGHSNRVYGVGITADGSRIFTGSADVTVRVWNTGPAIGRETCPPAATRYTNAKVLLVGDSGVGKTGLALRLARGTFEPTISTDAAWATQMRLSNEPREGVEREVWLWDFAGQADYRLIHQLFMDETALALVVFNPQTEDPIDGLAQWDYAITRAARRSFRKLLVAGRVDRGGLTVSREIIDRFRTARDYQGYFETSAVTGSGCDQLRAAIAGNIEWSEIPWTASPRLFRVLKDAILTLKDQGRVLLKIDELKQHVQLSHPEESFAIEELHAVIALLAGPGVVWYFGFGDLVLLQPHLINAYAAAVIRSVRSHPDELGCISEDRVVMEADLDFQSMARLPRSEEQMVLRALHQVLIERGLCLREQTDCGALLVFPSYYRRERPELTDRPPSCVSYRFAGALDEIYATLIVKLHHTRAFDRDQLWRNAADFRTPDGRRIGLELTKHPESRGEITVYMDPRISDDTKVTFIRYVHDHLRSKDPQMVRQRHYVCPHCDVPVEGRGAVDARLARGLTDVICANCEERIPLTDLVEKKFTSLELQRKVRELNKAALDQIKGEVSEISLINHAFATATEAGHRLTPAPADTPEADAAIEFCNEQQVPTGNSVLLTFRSRYELGVHLTEVDALQYLMRERGKWSAKPAKSSRPLMQVFRREDGSIRWLEIEPVEGTMGDGIRYDAAGLVKLFNSHTLNELGWRLAGQRGSTASRAQASSERA